MAGLAQIAMGTAPLAGGALLGVVAGQWGGSGTDVRALIKQHLDLLDRLPAELTERRAGILRTIDVRIDALIAAGDRNRALREEASSYQGSWRDLVLFLCVVLFGFIWWHLDHSKSYWLPTFIVLILLGGLTAAYGLRGLLRGVATSLRPRQP